MTEANLNGTVALITGASSGIGAATALALAAHGAQVAIAARRTDRLETVAARVEQAGGTALAVSADITQSGEAAVAVERTVERFGRLDILINSAGVMLLGPMTEAPLEEWQRMIDLNLSGLLYCTHAALPHLLDAAETSERGVADLVNISSVSGRVVRLGSGVYNLTKHGVGAMSESLRLEVTRRHVRVGLIEPGVTATELAGHNRESVRATINKRFSGAQRLDAEDISDAIVYMVTRPRHVAINEILIRPTDQEG